MSLPPAERLYKKNRNRFRLLDDHVRSGVNFLSTAKAITREWKWMGEHVMEFEMKKHEFLVKREKFNKKHGRLELEKLLNEKWHVINRCG
ncbi:hypothetical protein Hanom_Chr04g00356841 [Helianthus anomalus]